jgi:hypothetical protein
MESINSKLESFLAAGRYNEILAETIDSPVFVAELPSIPWIIGALSFLGRTAEAEGLFASYENKLASSDLIVARFFYALAVCRERRTKAARQLFLQNLKQGTSWINATDASQGEIEKIRFYMYQGLAFYRYTTGYFRQANFWVLKSLKAATGGNYAYGAALAHELFGHVQLQLGQIRAGLKSLEISSAKAQKLGQGALTQTFEAAKRLYRATYGLSHADQIVTDLNDALFKCRYEDSYTKASLFVHLAKIMTLKGDLKEASKLLDKASPLVYQVDNPYLETIYNLGLATVQMQRGSYSVALSIARNAAQRAQERTHIPSVIKSLGLQAIILEKLGMHRERTGILSTLRGLSSKTGGYIARRILARQEYQVSEFRRGEDPLGDLIDDIQMRNPGAIEDIFATGWIGLLRSALGIDPEQMLIVFDLEPGAMTIFANGHVEHKKEGYSHLIRKLLCTLANAGDVTKDELTAKLWGQNYNPLRHDALIYGLIARTRKLLGPFSSWIEVSEVGYRLQESVKVKNGLVSFRQIGDNSGFEPSHVTPTESTNVSLSQAEVTVESNQKDVDENSRLSVIMAHLNIRQIEVLKWTDSGEKIQPKDLIARLKVSDATATRDLSKLVELGAIQRCGSGRATFYCSSLGLKENV